LFKILKEVSHWDEATLKLFMFFLEKTEFGSTRDIQVGRREIEASAIHGRYFKDSRESLRDRGILSYQVGYIGKTRRKGTFYTLNTSSLM
jgi:hypothetical protein